MLIDSPFTRPALKLHPVPVGYAIQKMIELHVVLENLSQYGLFLFLTPTSFYLTSTVHQLVPGKEYFHLLEVESFPLLQSLQQGLLPYELIEVTMNSFLHYH